MSTPPSSATVRCPRCRSQIELASIQTSGDTACPSCRRRFEAVRFDPPLVAPLLPDSVAGMADGGQPCATHPRNAAVATCGRCGSFICTLCKIDTDGQVLCPACFERLSSEGALESTRTTFRDYPGLSLVAVTAGCLIWFLAILFGPLAIHYALKGLRQKKELNEQDGRIMLRLAIAAGVIQIAGSAAFIGWLLVRMFE